MPHPVLDRCLLLLQRLASAEIEPPEHRQVRTDQRQLLISIRLCISVKTVEAHGKQVMDNLGIHCVAELTKYAVRQGLTSLSHFIHKLFEI